MATLTRAEVLAEVHRQALETENEDMDNAFTTLEFAEELGVGRDKALRVLSGMERDGKVRAVRVRRRIRSGHVQNFPGWEMIENNGQEARCLTTPAD